MNFLIKRINKKVKKKEFNFDLKKINEEKNNRK
jgi:hypothetical protein